MRKEIESMEEERGDEDGNVELNDRIEHAKLLNDLLQEEFVDAAKAMEDCSCLTILNLTSQFGVR